MMLLAQPLALTAIFAQTTRWWRWWMTACAENGQG